MVRAKVTEDGDTLVRIRFRDWLTLACLLGGLVIGHYKLQAARFDALTDRMAGTEAKLNATVSEQSTWKAYFDKVIDDLRRDIRHLDRYLRETNAEKATSTGAGSKAE